MKYKLINKVNPKYSVTEQILTNRGIKIEDIQHYLNSSSKDVNSPLLFGEELMKKAADCLVEQVKLNNKIIVVVDADCDGFTSSALLLNYLHDLYPNWVENKVEYILHTEKQHGLNDHINYLLKAHPSLVIIPDAGTNDVKECQQLKEIGCSVIILDHHIQDIENPYAIIINNQTSDYPNKELSGVGVVWQFCKYLDLVLNKQEANKYLDLVAVGDQGDMIDLRSIETSYLIKEGLKDKNIHNPFLYGMIEKNRFSIGSEITPMGISFYVVPFINAMVRSGTMDEKLILFEAMLSWMAFKEVPSTKRGHHESDTEKIYEQAVRIASNVKARQTKAQDAAVEVMKKKIENENLLDHKVLMFLMEPGQIDKNIAGLIANKIMAKYQRPVCILTKVINGNEISYQGSARGCSKTGVTEFKNICAATGECMYEAGHEGAFGLGILKDNIPAFIEKTDAALKDITDEAIYYVDAIWQANSDHSNEILDIANMNHLWGQGIDEPLIAIENLKINSDMVNVYTKRGITIKITTSTGIALLLFNAKEEDREKLKDNNTGYISLNIVGRCNKNEWMGKIYPQIFIENYEIIDSNEYFF